MKKIIFFVLFFAVAWSVSAQELIMLGGGGQSKNEPSAKGEYGFAESRLMINLVGNFRVGPYIGYTQYASIQNYKTPSPKLLGKEWKYGISFDSYGVLTYSYDYYFWINTGLKSVNDRFQESFFNSVTKTKEYFISGGFFVTDNYQGWFGNNRIMFEYQKPISSTVAATWKDESISNIKPYNKESLRINFESGIKRLGMNRVVNVEPLVHLGWGQDFGRNKSYYEYGGGINIGTFKDWYRDIVKVKAFYRQDFSGTYVDINSQTPAKSFVIEAVFNASSLVKALKK
jgi:hypothetical protein